MNLDFQTGTLPYLRHIVHETRHQEEIGETIVPDSYPDIHRIIHAHGEAIIRGKDCRAGNVSISGGIKGCILYASEEGDTLRNLEFYLPFTLKAEHPDLTERSQCICSVQISSAAGTIINSRKAMLRAELLCKIDVYEQFSDEVFTLKTKPDDIQIKTNAYTVSLPLEVSEKSFLIDETLDLSMTNAPIDQICKFSCTIEVSDHKIIGNRGVFKGNALCKLLYLSADQHLGCLEQKLPFSQYCEFLNDYDEHDLYIIPVVTGYDLEPMGETLHLTLHLLIQAWVQGKRDLTILQDIYSTKDEIEAQWKEYDLECMIDSFSDAIEIRKQISSSLQELTELHIYPGTPELVTAAQTTQLKIPVKISAFGLNETGEFTAIHELAEAETEYALNQSSSCEILGLQIRNCTKSLVNGTLNLHFELAFTCIFSSKNTFSSLCGCKSLETDKFRELPSLIIRQVEAGTHLWDLAKEHRSRCETIAQVNRYDGEYFDHDGIVLIPVG